MNIGHLDKVRALWAVSEAIHDSGIPTRILREHVPREAEIKSKTRRRRMEVSRWAFVAVLLCFSSRACLAIFDLLSEPLLSHTSRNQLSQKNYSYVNKVRSTVPI
jgi:hypothetical protein